MDNDDGVDESRKNAAAHVFSSQAEGMAGTVYSNFSTLINWKQVQGGFCAENLQWLLDSQHRITSCIDTI